MIRKFTVCLMLSAWFLASSCDDEEAASPPKASFTVDKTSGLSDETVFTFEINQVNADAITLYPYGREKAAWGTVPITEFVDGKAKVEFKYAYVGEFEAVVLSNNHSDDGSSIKNTVSDPTSISIASNKAILTEFSLDYKKDSKTTISSTKSVIDQGTSTITVTLPYGVDITKLIAKFTVSKFAVVSIGTAVQVSGETENSFATDKVYTVKSQNGVGIQNWTVHAIVTPAETFTNIKTFTGKLKSKAVKDREVPSYIDSAGAYIVMYDIKDTPAANFDSVGINYAFTGKFATLKVGGKVAPQDTVLNLAPDDKTVTVTSQSGVSKVYSIYTTDAPKLTLRFDDLIPPVVGTTKDFGILLKVLTEADKEYTTYYDLDLPAGVNFVSITADGVAFDDGDVVDFDEGAKFVITVNDTRIGKTYQVTYNAVLGQL